MSEASAHEEGCKDESVKGEVARWRSVVKVRLETVLRGMEVDDDPT